MHVYRDRVRVSLLFPGSNMLDTAHSTDERHLNSAVLTAFKAPDVMYFGAYDGSSQVDIDLLIHQCLEISEENVLEVLYGLRDFVLQDEERVRECARIAEVPLIYWREKVTDPEVTPGNAIIVSFRGGKSTYTLPVSDALFTSGENVLAIFNLAKTKVLLDKAREIRIEQMDELHSILTEDFVHILLSANMNRILSAESNEEINKTMRNASDDMHQAVGWEELPYIDIRNSDWGDNIQLIHDFLIQPIPDGHPIRNQRGYERPRDNLYALVSSYISNPAVPREFIESIIVNRILPDLQNHDSVTRQIIRNISDLSMTDHHTFYQVLMGSERSAELSYYIAASADMFSTPQNAVETLAELFNYTKYIDEHLFEVVWNEFRRDIGDSYGYDVKMIQSMGDAMINRFGKLFSRDEQMILMESMLQEMEETQKSVRGNERVKALTNRIMFYLYNYWKDNGQTIHPDVLKTWYTWLSKRSEKDIEPWTIRFTLGMPGEFISTNTKIKFIGFLQENMNEFITTIQLTDDSIVEVNISRTELAVCTRLMEDTTTPEEVKQLLYDRIIAPLFSGYDVSRIDPQLVQPAYESLYDDALKLLARLRPYV